MKKYFSLVICLLCITTSSWAYTERNLLQKAAGIDFIKQNILPKEKWVVYPSYTDRAGWEKMMGNDKEYFIAEGEKALKYQWQIVKATDYLEFERSGNRNIMESPHNKNIAAIVNLFMAELAEGKGRFIDQLTNGVFTVCEMTSWSASAHLVLQKSKTAFPSHKEQIIELVSGDIGSLLSWIHYFLHNEFDKLNPLISDRIKYEIQRRILDPYMNINHLWWMAFNYKPGDMVNNWNPWCNSNVLQCFALMEDNPERLAVATYRTMVSVDHFINYVNNDGACEEGPSYWGHAAGKLYDYLQILYDITGGKISIFKEPMIKNMGEYISRSYIGNGWMVNFADASAKANLDADLIYRYGNAVQSKEMMDFAAYLKTPEKEDETHGNTRDIFRLLQKIYFKNTFKNIKQAYNTPAYTWYPETQFCYIKNNNGFFFAGKGGFNNESHNHNDVGSFNLYIDETPVIIDAGVGTYTRKTFSAERYSIWTMQSQYHNLPEINGYAQSFGAKYRAGNTTFNPAKNIFSSDISGAYTKDAGIKYWQRQYQLNKNSLSITDAFEINGAHKPNKINFLTWGKVDVSAPGKIFLNAENTSATLIYNSNEFDYEVETIALDDPRLSGIWGNAVYRISFTAKKITNKGRYNFTITK